MLAEYGIYLNCHIVATSEREVADYAEAERVRVELEEATKRDTAENNFDADDVWVQLEALYE